MEEGAPTLVTMGIEVHAGKIPIIMIGSFNFFVKIS